VYQNQSNWNLHPWVKIFLITAYGVYDFNVKLLYGEQRPSQTATRHYTRLTENFYDNKTFYDIYESYQTYVVLSSYLGSLKMQTLKITVHRFLF